MTDLTLFFSPLPNYESCLWGLQLSCIPEDIWLDYTRDTHGWEGAGNSDYTRLCNCEQGANRLRVR